MYGILLIIWLHAWNPHQFRSGKPSQQSVHLLKNWFTIQVDLNRREIERATIYYIHVLASLFVVSTEGVGHGGHGGGTARADVVEV